MVSRKKYADSCLEIVKEGRKIVKEWWEDSGEEKERERKRGKIEGKREVSPWREGEMGRFFSFL